MSLFSAIYEETGPGTTAEIRRLRKRLQYLESYKESLLQSLMGLGTGEGPEGTKGLFLRLDCANDPLTDTLDINGGLDVEQRTTCSGPLYVNPTTVSDVPVRINQGTGGSTSIDPDDSSVSSNLQWWWRASDESARVDGSAVTSFQLNASSLETDTTFTVNGGVTYRASTGPNSNEWIEVTSNNSYFTQAGDLELAAGFTVIGVYRTPTANNLYGLVWHGNSASAGKESFRHPGTVNDEPASRYLMLIDDEAVPYTTISDQVASGDVGEETWFVGVWRRDGDTNDIEAFHADQSTALANISLGTPANSSTTITIDSLWYDFKTGQQERGQLGEGAAEFIVYDRTLTDNELNQVYNYLANRHNFPTVGTDPGNMVQLEIDSTVKSVWDETGTALHIGGTDPQFNLDVEGTADISGALTSGTLQVSGLSTLSNTDVQALTAVSLEVSGLTTLSNTDVQSLTAVQLQVSGLTTLSNTDVQALTAASLQVSGLTTLSTTDAFHLDTDTLNVSGLTTLSATDVQSLTATSLQVTGLSTLSSTDAFHVDTDTLNVTGLSTLSSTDAFHVDTDTLNVTGLSTVSTIDAFHVETDTLGCSGLSTFTGSVYMDANLTVDDISSAGQFYADGTSSTALDCNSGAQIQLSTVSGSSVGTPSADHVRLFFDDETDEISVKKSDGSVVSLESVDTVSADGIYLRLDATNDPVTGDLDINAALDVQDETTLSSTYIGSTLTIAATTVSKVVLGTTDTYSFHVGPDPTGGFFTGVSCIWEGPDAVQATWTGDSVVAVTPESDLLVLSEKTFNGQPAAASLHLTADGSDGFFTFFARTTHCGISDTTGFASPGSILTIQNELSGNGNNGVVANIHDDIFDVEQDLLVQGLSTLSGNVVLQSNLLVNGAISTLSDLVWAGDDSVVSNEQRTFRVGASGRDTTTWSLDYIDFIEIDRQDVLGLKEIGMRVGAGTADSAAQGGVDFIDLYVGDHDEQPIRLMSAKFSGNTVILGNGSTTIDVSGDMQVLDTLTLLSAGISIDHDTGILIGEGQDSRIWYDGTDLQVDAALVGSGIVKIANNVDLDAGSQLVLSTITESSVATPSTDHISVFLSEDSGKLSVKKDDGSVVSLEEQGGSGITTASADARYLLLDATNDPITGDLDLDAALDVQGATTLSAVTVSGAAILNTLNVSSLTTLSTTDAFHVDSDTLNVSGLTTLSSTDAFHVDSDTLNVSGLSTLSSTEVFELHLDDNNEVFFGTGDDASIDYDGTDLQLDTKAVGSGDFNVNTTALRLSDTQSDTTNKIIRIQAQPYNLANLPVTLLQITNTSGASTLNHGGGSSIESAVTSHAFYTAASPGTTTGTLQWSIIAGGNLRNEDGNNLDMSTGDILMDDNSLLYFGTQNDSRMYYDGTNVILDTQVVGSGDFVLEGGDLDIDGGSGIILSTISASSVATPSSDHATLFFSDDDDDPAVKFSDGRVRSLTKRYMQVHGGRSPIQGSDAFLYAMDNSTASSDSGVVIPRNASIVAMSANFHDLSSVTTGTAYLEVWTGKSSDLAIVCTMTLASIGVADSTHMFWDNFEPGSFTVDEGELVKLRLNFDGFNVSAGRITSMALFELDD